MNKISVLIMEQHLLFRESLARVLESNRHLEVTGVTGSFDKALSFCNSKTPDILVVGTHISPLDGFAVLEKIKAHFPRIRVIGLCADGGPSLVKRFFKLGGSGYITKHSSCSEFIDAVHSVIRGETYLSNDVKAKLLTEKLMPEGEPLGLGSLTRKELQVLQEVRNGKSSRLLAMELGVSIKTVETHRYRILKKLNIKNSAALVQHVHTLGI